MSLLDKINKENINSSMQVITNKYSSKFHSFHNDTELYYEKGEFKLRGTYCARFNFDALNSIHDEIQRKIILSTDLDLCIETCDSSRNGQMEIKTSGDIEIIPTVRNAAYERVTTIENVNIFADVLKIACTYIKLFNVNIKTKLLTLHDLTCETLCNNISGYVKTSQIYMHMNTSWDFDRIFKSITNLNIPKGFPGIKLNETQINELLNTNPITRSGIGVFNTNTYRIAHHSNYFIITRDQSIISTFEESSYKMADGWYLICTVKSVNLYEFIR